MQKLKEKLDSHFNKMNTGKKDLLLLIFAVICLTIVYNKYSGEFEFNPKKQIDDDVTPSKSTNEQNEIKPVVKCDTNAAKLILKNLNKMASWKTMDGVIIVKWTYVWDDLAPEEKIKLLEAFSDAAACIVGGSPEIRFYRKGNLVGKADRNWGVNLQ